MELNLLRKISASTQSFSFSVVLSQFRQYSMGAYFLPKIPNFPEPKFMCCFYNSEIFSKIFQKKKIMYKKQVFSEQKIGSHF